MRPVPTGLLRLPAIGQLLDAPILRDAIEVYGRDAARVQARAAVEAVREAIRSSEPPGESVLRARIEALPETIVAALARGPLRPMQPVLNATGVFLHTNLGRSPLPSGLSRELAPLVEGWCDLEIDLATGRRSDRARRPSALLESLTGAERALVVNNGAAALVLALAALAGGSRVSTEASAPSTLGHKSSGGERREVIVSRGELVEIGGSFRIPDMIEAAGAERVEVGTTNRTRLSDYANAITDRTAVLLKIFPSNYRMIGFVGSVSPRELAALGRDRGIPTLVDEGSGLLARSERPQLAEHPSLSELLADGVDLAFGSGDKVLGGPQAGLLVGRRELVDRCRNHPLYRTYRAGRLVHATLEQVLRRQLRGDPAPLDRLWPDPGAHRLRLETLRSALEEATEGLEAEIVPADGALGGGTAPERPVPGEALAIPGGSALARDLANPEPAAGPPVLATVREGRLLLDLRTIDPSDDGQLVRCLAAALRTQRAAP